MVIVANSSEGLQDKPTEHRSSPQPKQEWALSEAQHHLLQKLQTTLELSTLLGLFYETIQHVIRVDGLKYLHNNGADVQTFGETRQHNVDYNISSETQTLGTLSFSRDKRFSEAELVALEILIGCLHHPLRNALLYREAVQSSMKDALTGVGNRTALAQALTREVELAKRFHRPFSLLLIDVDHFKNINDTLGHAAGDAALQHLAQKISSSLRQVDEVFRYGGEEFVVLLTNADNKAPLLVAERIRKGLSSEPLKVNDTTLELTVSIGLSVYQRHDCKDSLFGRADQALYTAKNSGRNCVVMGADKDGDVPAPRIL